MKLSKMIMTVLFCILIVGCQEKMEEGPGSHLINSQLLRSFILSNFKDKFAFALSIFIAPLVSESH